MLFRSNFVQQCLRCLGVFVQAYLTEITSHYSRKLFIAQFVLNRVCYGLSEYFSISITTINFKNFDILLVMLKTMTPVKVQFYILLYRWTYSYFFFHNVEFCRLNNLSLTTRLNYIELYTYRR